MEQTSVEYYTQQTCVFTDSSSQQNLERNRGVYVEDNDTYFSVCAGIDTIHFMNVCIDITSVF